MPDKIDQNHLFSPRLGLMISHLQLPLAHSSSAPLCRGLVRVRRPLAARCTCVPAAFRHGGAGAGWQLPAGRAWAQGQPRPPAAAPSSRWKVLNGCHSSLQSGLLSPWLIWSSSCEPLLWHRTALARLRIKAVNVLCPREQPSLQQCNT